MTPVETGTNERLMKAAEAAAFIVAGKAVFTLRSMATGTRYTFRVRRAEGKGYLDSYFVSCLTGQDNEGDYTYLGMIRNGAFSLTKASKMTKDSGPVKAFAWVWGKLAAGVEPVNVEIWHAGHCGRCGRLLTVPESVESGYGPECIGRVAK